MYLAIIRKYCYKCPASNTICSHCWNNHPTNMYSRNRKCCTEWFADNRDLDTNTDSGRNYNYRDRNKYNYLRTCIGTYTYTVTNAAGCISSPSGSIVINAQPATPAAPTVGTITQPTCSIATGSVVLNGLPATGTWTLTRTPEELRLPGQEQVQLFQD